MRRTRTILAALLIIAGTTLAQTPGLKRTDLQQHDLSVPGREVVQVRGLCAGCGRSRA